MARQFLANPESYGALTLYVHGPRCEPRRFRATRHQQADDGECRQQEEAVTEIAGGVFEKAERQRWEETAEPPAEPTNPVTVPTCEPVSLRSC